MVVSGPRKIAGALAFDLSHLFDVSHMTWPPGCGGSERRFGEEGGPDVGMFHLLLPTLYTVPRSPRLGSGGDFLQTISVQVTNRTRVSRMCLL